MTWLSVFRDEADERLGAVSVAVEVLDGTAFTAFRFCARDSRRRFETYFGHAFEAGFLKYTIVSIMTARKTT